MTILGKQPSSFVLLEDSTNQDGQQIFTTLFFNTWPGFNYSACHRHLAASWIYYWQRKIRFSLIVPLTLFQNFQAEEDVQVTDSST